MVVAITQLYSHVFDSIQFERMKARKNLLSARSWVDVFVRMERDKSIRDEVIKCLNKFSLTEKDLRLLQRIRRVRNELCHPKVRLEDVRNIINASWKGHPAYKALSQICTVLRNPYNTGPEGKDSETKEEVVEKGIKKNMEEKSKE